ncbi:unnamed protein product [Dibothriocephalus latus]|uniref:Uncharacterized protein n=1 Tax=Dibothriocephalus latus TaxID=60516 RepID=A0A3P7L2N5_DIBLA|nr:unnamed protein product [Dibothriocephalus latus]
MVVIATATTEIVTPPHDNYHYSIANTADTFTVNITTSVLAVAPDLTSLYGKVCCAQPDLAGNIIKFFVTF